MSTGSQPPLSSCPWACVPTVTSLRRQEAALQGPVSRWATRGTWGSGPPPPPRGSCPERIRQASPSLPALCKQPGEDRTALLGTGPRPGRGWAELGRRHRHLHRRHLRHLHTDVYVTQEGIPWETAAWGPLGVLASWGWQGRGDSLGLGSGAPHSDTVHGPLTVWLAKQGVCDAEPTMQGRPQAAGSGVTLRRSGHETSQGERNGE